jgi:hypothetical protein
MKNMLSIALSWAAMTVLFAGIAGCSKKSDSGDSPKTLNKSSLTNNKEWYNQGSSIVHIFKSSGVYTNTGTWKWVNNSDTMEIVTVSGGYKTYWKFFWNTDNEMNCQRIATGTSPELYKRQGW